MTVDDDGPGRKSGLRRQVEDEAVSQAHPPKQEGCSAPQKKKKRVALSDPESGVDVERLQQATPRERIENAAQGALTLLVLGQFHEPDAHFSRGYAAIVRRVKLQRQAARLMEPAGRNIPEAFVVAEEALALVLLVTTD